MRRSMSAPRVTLELSEDSRLSHRERSPLVFERRVRASASRSMPSRHFHLTAYGVLFLCHHVWSLFLVSSRPESAERRDPGFRPRALAPTYGEADRVRLFLRLEVFVSFPGRSEESQILRRRAPVAPPCQE